MINITSINRRQNQICRDCNKKQFYCVTPNGGDYTTCPICDGREFKYDIYNHRDPSTFYDNYEDEDTHNYNYCKDCGIIYDNGCTHKVFGCTDDLYNAHFIGKWEHLETNIIYIGMPYFESVKDWEDNASKVKILEWICPNTYKHCDSDNGYCKKKYPNHYYLCNLHDILHI